MLPIRLKYHDPMIKKKRKRIFRKSKIRNKTKTHQPNQKQGFLTRHHAKKTKKMRTLRLKSTE